MKKIFAVKFLGTDWDKYFGGSANFIVLTRKFFSTEEKAQEFIDNEYSEYVDTWDEVVVVKEAGDGTLEILEID